MPLSVSCKSCGTKLKVPDRLAGKHIRCPKCSMGVLVKPSEPVEVLEELELAEDDDAPRPVRRPKPSPARSQSAPAQRGSDLEFLEADDEADSKPARARPVKSRREAVASAAAADQDLDFLDADSEVEQAPARKRGASARAAATARDDAGDDLSEGESGLESHPRREHLPARRVKKKPKPVRIKREKKRSGQGDVLVWTMLAALIPLAIMMVFPKSSIEHRILKTIEHQEELEEDEDLDAREFLAINPNLSLEGAHLSRDSLMHWVYALLSTICFATLFAMMRSATKVSSLRLVLTGIFTGTFGIVMLLAFQFLALWSLTSTYIGAGYGAIFFLILRFIGFSYYCALDPNNGFILSFIGFTCGVGLCEELVKVIPVIVYLRGTRYSDWRGAALLGMASGAGFGISEGIMYAGQYYNGIEPGMIYAVRFSSCVALHALWSGSVALLMFGNQDYLEIDGDMLPFLWGMLQYVLIAMVLHGLYDTMLKQQHFILALLTAFATFGWMAWLSKYYWTYEPEPEPAMA